VLKQFSLTGIGCFLVLSALAASSLAAEGAPSAEGAGNVRRTANGQAVPPAMNNFRPQTPREAQLFQILLELNREVAQMRAELAQMSGSQSQPGSTGGTSASVNLNTKDGRVFKAYDKNSDLVVTVDEWLAMKRVAETDTARVNLESERFNEADPNKDGQMTAEEFLYWYTKGRFQK